MPNSRSAKLARWQIRLLVMSGCLLWLSGGAWLYLHYFRQIEGEFGPEVNPLEPWMMRLHGLVLIPALLALGGLLVAHIPKGWKDVAQRNIGLGLSAVLCLLIISGYLLYYVGDDVVRSWSGVIHWSIGLGSPTLFIWHFLRGKKKQERRSQTRRSSRPGKSAH